MGTQVFSGSLSSGDNDLESEIMTYLLAVLRGEELLDLSLFTPQYLPLALKAVGRREPLLPHDHVLVICIAALGRFTNVAPEFIAELAVDAELFYRVNLAMSAGPAAPANGPQAH
jgi:hypothetical protein